MVDPKVTYLRRKKAELETKMLVRSMELYVNELKVRISKFNNEEYGTW